jgi:phenylacetic acid degradation operon negative regulatory protein
VVDRWCTGWAGAHPSPRPDARDLWDLEGWSAEAEQLQEQMALLHPRLVAGDTRALADGFTTSAAVLRHLQADPLLPEELLWMDWPGVALREDYDVYDRAYRTLLRDWFRH